MQCAGRIVIGELGEFILLVVAGPLPNICIGAFKAVVMIFVKQLICLNRRGTSLHKSRGRRLGAHQRRNRGLG